MATKERTNLRAALSRIVKHADAAWQACIDADRHGARTAEYTVKAGRPPLGAGVLVAAPKRGTAAK